jgi:hypothetical protein
MEPAMNDWVHKLELLLQAYPPRLLRRCRVIGALFVAEFDFAAYFDQFELSEAVRPYFVIRTRMQTDGTTNYVLTRLPMGARFAPGVAQLVTWVVIAPLLQLEGVVVDTMIDNVRIAATTPEAFLKAVRLFLDRVATANLTLNDAEMWNADRHNDSVLLQKWAVAGRPYNFLGKRYLDATVANAPRTVDKLRAAWERYCAPGVSPVTARQFASLIGLALWMAHTVGVELWALHTLLRAYGRMLRLATSWESPVRVDSPAVHEQLSSLVLRLVANVPVALPVVSAPSLRNGDYDACVIVDASASGWGAYVQWPATGKVWLLRQRWATAIQHSAHAEPRALLEALRWIRASCRGARVAVVTDHASLASGQRRWISAFGGFSTSYWLNACYAELYGNGSGEVFVVPGDQNPADAPSRDLTATTALDAHEVGFAFPPIEGFSHPYLTSTRPEEMV